MTEAPHSLPSGPDPRVLLAHHLKALKLPTMLHSGTGKSHNGLGLGLAA